MMIWIPMVPVPVRPRRAGVTGDERRTHAACIADERAHGLPAGSCLKTHGGELPGPHVDLDSEGVER